MYYETFGPVVYLTRLTVAKKLPSTAGQVRLSDIVYTQDLEKSSTVTSRKSKQVKVGINCYAIENMNVACPWVGHEFWIWFPLG
jgi:acyl-CoA reductase-like NAD-dependent aldehyde dehydrogenase